MFRADDPDADANANGTGKAGYTEGSPGVTAPTPVRADALNNIQEELCLAVEDAGITLDKTVKRQLSQALNLRAARQVLSGQWTLQSPSGTPDEFFGAVWFEDSSDSNDSLWVAFGANGGIQTSPNGITWTARTAAGGYTDNFAGGAHDGSIIVLVGANAGSPEIQTSADGATWTARAGASTNDLNDVVYSSALTLFCAVGYAGNIETSANGTSWTSRTAAGSANFFGVAWDPSLSLFCAVGASGTIETSPDGITWTARTAAASYADNFRGVQALPGGGFVAAGDGDEIQSSTDGITWTALSSDSATASVDYIGTALVEGVFVAMGDDIGLGTFDKALQVTADGTAVVGLYGRPLYATSSLRDVYIAKGGDQYLAVGRNTGGNGAIATSDVGVGI